MKKNLFIKLLLSTFMLFGVMRGRLFNDSQNHNQKVYAAEVADVEAKWGPSIDNLTAGKGTLKEAIESGTNYIQLQSNVSLTETITVTSGTFTLDLNGYTIAFVGDDGIWGGPLTFVLESTNVTIANTAEVKGTIRSTGVGLQVDYYASLHLKNVEVIGTSHGIATGEGATLTIDNSNIIGETLSGINHYGSLIMNSGNIVGTEYAINQLEFDSASTIINDGSISGTEADIWWSKGTIDLSNLEDPKGITILYYTSSDLSSQITLSEGYCLYDEENNKVEELIDDVVYTIDCDHVDTNPKDHKCDTCENIISSCLDSNNDHLCDYCLESISQHEYLMLHYDEQSHWYECVCGEKDPTTIVDHNFTYVDNTGMHTKLCDCGYSGDENHLMSAWVTIVEPSCETTGNERSECEYCDYYTDNEISATGHIYEAVVTDPSCIKEGYTTYTCICGLSYIDNRENALGHSGGMATCTDQAVCEVCNQEYGDVISTNHNYSTEWSNDDTNHYHECACGDKKDVAIHIDSNNDGVCDICEYDEMPDDPGISNPIDPNSPTDPKPDRLSGGTIAGIVIGSIAIVGLGGFAIYYFVIKKKK